MSAPYQKTRVVVNLAACGDKPILNTLDSVFPQYEINWDVSITNSAASWLPPICTRDSEISCR